MYKEDFIGLVALSAVGILVAIALAILFIYMPVSLNNSAKCLAAGYATSDTTWNLKGYCISADLIHVVPVNEVGK